MTVRQPVPASPRPHEEAAEAPAQERIGGEDLIQDVDRLLDEIDGVLEEQAVLLNYRQRSGQ
jgi:hypothetical protein